MGADDETYHTEVFVILRSYTDGIPGELARDPAGYDIPTCLRQLGSHAVAQCAQSLNLPHSLGWLAEVIHNGCIPSVEIPKGTCISQRAQGWGTVETIGVQDGQYNVPFIRLTGSQSYF